ncbi:MAG: aspartate--tRNA(Asn) ligase [Candidatus Hodarchaeales archaeon]|jgi:aspartyl/asparaginyl-tRNA synthetase
MSHIFGMSEKFKTHPMTAIASDNAGDRAKVAGWLHIKRDKGKLKFLRLRDSSGIAQITIHKAKVSAETWDNAEQLTPESVVSVEGIVRADPRAPRGAELAGEDLNISILSLAAPRVPIDITLAKTKFDVDTAFKFRELSIRTKEVISIMKIKNIAAKLTRGFFQSRGFVEIFTPFILTTATEGGATMFELDYFGKKAVLAQSNQFYKQAAISCHEKVFGIIPSWRAEKSRTPKHLTEFHQIENEIAFATVDDLMKIQEELVRYIIQGVKKEASEDLEILEQDLRVPKLPLKRLRFSEAKALCFELNVEEPEDEDFGATAETVLSKHHEDPFFITHFPTALRGIYYEEDADDPTLTASIDLMGPQGFGELSSGGERVFRKDRLIERIQQANLRPESFEWYLRMFEYGMPPHAGYGLGFERLIRWVCSLSHLREAVLFPRTPDLWTP